jgi:hypothetical protein
MLLVRFPVVCPRCGFESLVSFRYDAVNAALQKNHALQLRSPCHAQRWYASDIELEQIREYCRVVDYNADPGRSNLRSG